VLWYRQPGTAWLQGMPLGNGMIGAMVFGGVPQERIALNESSFWSGGPHDYDDPNAFKYFPQIRDLIFADKFQDAEKLADEHFRGLPYAQEAYQPIGDLLLDFAAGAISDYRRELDMETGIAKVTYRQGEAIVTRETFVSWPDRILVTRISADKPAQVSLAAQFKGPYLEKSLAQPGRLVMDGTWKGRSLRRAPAIRCRLRARMDRGNITRSRSPRGSMAARRKPGTQLSRSATLMPSPS
jgi:alpha-L-fucosidase 2